ERQCSSTHKCPPARRLSSCMYLDSLGLKSLSSDELTNFFTLLQALSLASRRQQICLLKLLTVTIWMPEQWTVEIRTASCGDKCP
ncbi:hypothetical protein SeMB42_g03593, partial [Synchytrium endobioticum]